MKLHAAAICIVMTAPMAAVQCFQIGPMQPKGRTTPNVLRDINGSGDGTVGAFGVSYGCAARSSRSDIIRLHASASASAEAAEDATTTKVERMANSAVSVEIPVPGTATKAAYDKVCNELSKNIQIPGFRKGAKIPPAILEQSMAAKGGRNALKVQAINELINQLVEPALREQALDPIGQPRLTVPAEEMATTFQPGEPMTLALVCDVWPEIQWKGSYTDLNAKYQRKPFDEQKLQTALNDLKERYVTLDPIIDTDTEHYTLQMGDACTVNMVGYMAAPDGSKGELLPNAASGDRVEVVLGNGRYMEGLVEGLVGAKVGETVVVTVTFPDKLRDKTLAGKKAVFDVEVLDASRRTVPEITDEFAAIVKPDLTAESLMAQLKKAIDDENSREFVPARNKALGEALSKVMDVEVPDTLVTNQAREKFAIMMSEMRDGGVSDEEIKRQISPENFLKYKDIVKSDIIRDFKISMATDEIARLEGVDVPDYQVEEQMEAIRKDADKDEAFDENLIRSKVKNTLVRQAVMDWLAERSNLEVEYLDQEPEFDEALLDKLAQESLIREGVSTVGPTATIPDADKVDASTKLTSPAEVDAEVIHNKGSSVTATPKPSVIDAELIPAAQVRESEMTLEEKAFQALVNAGAVKLNVDPTDPDYDRSQDNEIASGTVFKQ